MVVGMADRSARRSPARRRIVRIVVAAALIAVIAVIFTSCSSMTIASWRAIPALADVVGDRGEVTASIRESRINVSPDCTLSVSLAAGTTTTEISDVLSSIAPVERFEPCTVRSVQTDSRAEVYSDDWDLITAEGWNAIADMLTRSGQVSLFVSVEKPSAITSFSDPEAYADFVAKVEALTAGAPLEESIGPVRWTLDWSQSTGAFNEVRIATDETPSPAFAVFLNAIAPQFGSEEFSIGVTHVITDGKVVTRVECSEPDAEMIAEVTAAFEKSGLDGALNFAE
ncbi:hypothetical protein [Humidisolicoccus flavus]|uniref:hypothetical protein n=1 Tax=Humidisolicoccus flavus TaxID=3111414 RepID=UPI0032562CCB